MLRNGPDGYSDLEEAPEAIGEEDPAVVDLRIVEGRDDEYEDDFRPSGVGQWILREWLGTERVEAGPFDLNDEDTFDDALVEMLRQHPWDDAPVYRVLVLDPKEGPWVEELTEYLQPLLEEAWDASGEEIAENDSLGG